MCFLPGKSKRRVLATRRIGRTVSVPFLYRLNPAQYRKSLHLNASKCTLDKHAFMGYYVKYQGLRVFSAGFVQSLWDQEVVGSNPATPI